jgi:hypothetical protein
MTAGAPRESAPRPSTTPPEARRKPRRELEIDPEGVSEGVSVECMGRFLPVRGRVMGPGAASGMLSGFAIAAFALNTRSSGLDLVFESPWPNAINSNINTIKSTKIIYLIVLFMTLTFARNHAERGMQMSE